MDPTALIIETFGAGSLAVALAKYTIERRKTMNAEDHMKNHGLTCRLNNSHTNSHIS